MHKFMEKNTICWNRHDLKAFSKFIRRRKLLLRVFPIQMEREINGYCFLLPPMFLLQTNNVAERKKLTKNQNWINIKLSMFCLQFIRSFIVWTFQVEQS